MNQEEWNSLPIHQELIDYLKRVDERNHSFKIPRVLQEADDILHEKSFDERD